MGLNIYCINNSNTELMVYGIYILGASLDLEDRPVFLYNLKE